MLRILPEIPTIKVIGRITEALNDNWWLITDIGGAVYKVYAEGGQYAIGDMVVALDGQVVSKTGDFTAVQTYWV